MATFLEGVESILLACSLVVVVPILLVALAAKSGRVWTVAGAVVGTSTMMWARAARLWELDPDGRLRWLIAGAIIATFAGSFRADNAGAAVRFGFGIAAGLIAAWLWQPCVGEHFAEVLNRAETAPLGSLVKMHAYVIGLLLPTIAVAALPHAVPAASRPLRHRYLRRASLAVALAYAAAVALGWYTDLVGELFRVSSR